MRTIKIFLVLFISLAFYMNTNAQWTMANSCKERTSFAANENVLHPPLEQLATLQVWSEYMSYYDGILYLGVSNTPNQVQAVNAETGDVIWTFDLPETAGDIGVYPAVSEDLVFCGGENGLGLHAINRSTGQQEWFKPIGNTYTRNPILDQDRLYIIGDSLYCLNASNGSTIWSYPMQGQLTPTVDDNYVYSFGAGCLNAFDKLTGVIIWQIPTGYNAFAAIAVDDNYLYADLNSTIKTYQKNTGVEVWSFNIPDGTVSGLSAGPFALANDILCISVWSNSDSKGMIYAIDATNGTQKWDYTFDGTGTYSPSIANGVVYVVEWSMANIWGFDLNTGNEVFNETSPTYYGQPIIANHKLFAATNTGIKVFQSETTSVSDYYNESQNNMLSIIPNPVTDFSKLNYRLNKASNVNINIYDNVGRKIRQIKKSHNDKGNYEIDLNINELAGGTYFVVLKTNDKVYRAKLIKN